MFAKNQAMSILYDKGFSEEETNYRKEWCSPNFELISKEIVAGGSYQGNETNSGGPGPFPLPHGPHHPVSAYTTTPFST